LAKLKIAVVGLPGKWSTETLAEEVYKQTGFSYVIDMNEVTLDLATGALMYKDEDLCQFDALIIKKISSDYSPNTLDRLELLRVAENAGVSIFSQPESILRLIDRLSCTVTLSNAGIPMPATRITESITEAVSAVKDFGSAIFKPLYSTKARGMYVINQTDGKTKVLNAIQEFKANNPMMYIQQKVALGGKDMGLMFLANQYLGAYARVSKNNAWNTTIHSGGSYESAQPSQAIIEMADKAQRLFNMSYTTVDVAETKQGAIVFEVSAFGGFRGGKEGMDLNVAKLYVEHVLEKLADIECSI